VGALGRRLVSVALSSRRRSFRMFPMTSSLDMCARRSGAQVRVEAEAIDQALQTRATEDPPG